MVGRKEELYCSDAPYIDVDGYRLVLCEVHKTKIVQVRMPLFLANWVKSLDKGQVLKILLSNRGGIAKSKEKKDSYIVMTLSYEDYDKVLNLARKKGVPFSAYVRGKLLSVYQSETSSHG